MKFLTSVLSVLLCVMLAVGSTGCGNKQQQEEMTDSLSTSKSGMKPPKSSEQFKQQCDARFESKFTPDVRQKANSAADIEELSDVEKQVFYYLNLARLAPQTFAKTYAQAYTGLSGYENDETFDARKASLIQEMEVMQPMPLLEFDEDLTETADCYATVAGQRGLRGHGRKDTGCTRIAGGECLQYSACRTGLDVVMELLVDAGEHNANLGHRHNCLRPDFHFMGVAIRPHKVSKENAVLDFAV